MTATKAAIGRAYAMGLAACFLANGLMWLSLGTDKHARLFGVFVAMPILNGVLLLAAWTTVWAWKSELPAGSAAGHAAAVTCLPVIAMVAALALAACFPATGSGC